MFRTRKKQAGFSMIDAVAAIVVVALAAAPLTNLIYSTLTQDTQNRSRTTALALARGLMEEILSKNFEDPDLSAGSFGTEEASRDAYDDVDDYDGLSQSPPRDSLNNALTRYSGFRQQVTVENVAAADPGGSAAADGSTDFKRITVTISGNDGTPLARLVGVISNFAGSSGPLPGLTYLGRVDTSSAGLEFRVRNDTGKSLYLTHLTATWGSPTAYYEQIMVNVEGYQDYGVVWDMAQRCDVRNESGTTAMFNQGDIVLVPDGRVMDIRVDNFYNNRKGNGATRDMEGTSFTIDLWAAPYKFQPITVPALP